MQAKLLIYLLGTDWGRALVKLLLGLLGVALVVFAFLIALAASAAAPIFALGQHAAAPEAENALREIPPAYLVAYQSAGARHGVHWQVVAAIGQVESQHGDRDNPMKKPPRGCIEGPMTPYGTAKGPMQFLDSTWALMGLDGNGDGRKEVCLYEDAIPTTALYLKQSGAPGDYRKAIYAYNHAGWYVDKVLAVAASYGYIDPSLLTTDCPPPPPTRPHAMSADAKRLDPGTQAVVDLIMSRSDLTYTYDNPSGIYQGYGHRDTRPVNTFYGPLHGYQHFHPGLDLPAPRGVEVRAPAAGTAVQVLGGSGPEGRNKEIRLLLPNGSVWHFYHLSAQIAEGPVSEGELLGLVGSTGYSSGPHLHIEVKDSKGEAVPLERWMCSLGAYIGEAAARGGQ